MLPITRKSLRIPHGLAMLAAAIGLAASLAWPTVEETRPVEQNADSGQNISAHDGMAEANEVGESRNPEPRDCRRAGCRGQSRPIFILPPLLPDLRFF